MDLSFDVTSPDGSIVFEDVATITVPEDYPYIRLEPTLLRLDEGLALTLNGRAIMKSPESGRSYTVNMPCMIAVEEQCYRIQSILPGYDAPLKVKPGVYTLNIALSWRAKGRGTLKLRIIIRQDLKC